MEMTRESVEEFIKKCATFVGKDFDDVYSRCTNDLYNCGWRNPECIENPINWDSYHSDWNSIMEVVDKIESITYGEDDFEIEGIQLKYTIHQRLGKASKTAVIQSIDQFIDWYNKQKEL